jgi:hypothetical protein
LSPENDAGCAEYHNTHTYEGENKPPKSELIQTLPITNDL